MPSEILVQVSQLSLHALELSGVFVYGIVRYVRHRRRRKRSKRA